MFRNFSLFKIEKVKKKIKSKDLIKIVNLIKYENKDSILAKLSDELIISYIKKTSLSKNFFLFLLKQKKKVIGYALFVKDEKYLINIFEKKKKDLIIYLFVNFNFFTCLNILLAILKLDLIFLKKRNKKNLSKSLNLNLLAIDKKYQSMGIGKTFLKKIITIIRNKYKFKILTCEAPNNKVLNFYLKKIKFKLVGKKIRFFKNQYVLEKHYK